MTGLAYAFERAHAAEQDVFQHLQAIADRHRKDHEVFHVAHDLARWSRDNLAQLAEVAERYDVELDAEPERPSVIDKVSAAAAQLVSDRPSAGIALLEDMRDLYLRASASSLAWEMLAQHAQAKQERDILDLTGRCHPQTLRQIRWANTMLKTLSPQVLASL
jgi:hypothetical protein